MVFKPWLNHLRPGKSTMSAKTLLRLLQSLNLRLSKDELAAMIVQHDNDRHDGRLNFEEFISLMRKNRSFPILTYLFLSHASDDKMSVSQLVEFFQLEQKQKLTNEEAAILVNKFSMGKTYLDEQAFQMLMMCADENRAMKPEKEVAHHDMGRPLNEYFIDSSHNTYCSGDQLKSESSIEMYVRAFTSGCRCVELDLWDGPGGEPIVYHGHTLTSKILFVDILRVVKSHGFKTSPFPIVLSFENHCSLEVCDRMAVLLEEVLGEMLLRPEAVAGQAFVNILGQEGLLSPDRLRNRVLVKATAVAEATEGLDQLVDELDEEERAKGTGPKRDKLSEALSKLVYLKATRLKRFKDADLWSPTQMCSFSEPRTWKMFARGDAGVLELSDFCRDYIARIYPRGTRFDSSNFDPVLPWSTGCQMVSDCWFLCSDLSLFGAGGPELSDAGSRHVDERGQVPRKCPQWVQFANAREAAVQLSGPRQSGRRCYYLPPQMRVFEHQSAAFWRETAAAGDSGWRQGAGALCRSIAGRRERHQVSVADVVQLALSGRVL